MSKKIYYFLGGALLLSGIVIIAIHFRHYTVDFPNIDLEHDIDTVLSLIFIAISFTTWFFGHLQYLDQRSKSKFIENFRTLLDESSLVSATDHKGDIIYANKAFSDLSGYSQSELIGNNHRILKSEEHTQQFMKGLWETISNGGSWKGIIKNKKKNGGYYWVNTTIVPFRNQITGKYDYYSVRQDITKLYDTFQALGESQKRNALAQDAAEIGFWDWDIAKNTLFWSDNIYKIFGISDTYFAASYEAFIEFVYPDDRQIVNSAVEACLKDSDKDYRVEHRILHKKSGEKRWLLETGKVYFDSSKNPTRMIGIVQDIHELKTAELRVKEQNLQIQHISKLELMGELAGGISHELKNPLMIISGLSEVAKKEIKQGKPEQALESLVELKMVVDKTVKIINNINRISRKAEGDPIEDKTISEVFTIVKSLSGYKIEDEKVNFNITIEDNLTISTRLVELSQAILIFVNNAVDACEDSEKREINLTAKVSTYENSLDVIISDSGQGIKEQDLTKIFEPYFTTKEMGKGTGVGLSIANRIIGDHKGKIRVDSELGVGTKFTLTFPLADNVKVN
ncbi:MAG: PAS domain-containing protein [Flavobacteriaceae bacterium]|nr:PAS domain-containing protein [Flavobacteriaceae bacterium]